MTKEMQKYQPIIVFKGNNIRRTMHNNEWWFVVKNIVEALTDTINSTDYIKKMRQRDPSLAEGWGQIVTPLSVETPGGSQKLNCANTEGVFRIIQSIPSPKAEPFKRWLAKVGYERVQEIEDPELATKRTRALYKAKGYPDDWIEKRMRGIAIRDHMTDLELIFSMLGEASTTEIAVQRDAQGFAENKKTARAGGNIAGNARKELEQKSGRKVVSTSNFLNTTLDKEEDPGLLPHES